MAVPFKIPKKQPSEQDSVQMLSPLSRIQDVNNPFKTSNWGHSNGIQPDKSCPLSKAERLSRPNKPTLREVGLVLPVYIGSPWRQMSDSPVQRKPAHMQTSSVIPKPLAGQRPSTSTSSCLTSGWRPKRASDKLCHDENQEIGCVSPQRKSHRSGLKDLPGSVPGSPVESEEDCAAEPSPEKGPPCATGHRRPGDASRRKDNGARNGCTSQNSETEGGNFEPATSAASTHGCLRRDTLFGTPASGTAVEPASVSASACSARRSGEDTFHPALPRTRPWTPADRASPPSRLSPGPAATGESPDRRPPSLNRTPLHASHTFTNRPMEKEGGKERARAASNYLSLHLRLRRPKQASTEPIVLSSEEDEEGEAEDQRSPSLRSRPRPSPGSSSPKQKRPAPEGDTHTQVGVGRGLSAPKPGSPQHPPPIMELAFVALQAGTVRAEANGNVTVRDDGITLPLKDPQSAEEEAEGMSVSLVASQLRGYGVWDGGLAWGGGLLRGWEGPPPSLLFLWVSEAQAGLVQTELSAVHPVTNPAPPCPFLLLVLQEQLSDLQAALLASMLDAEAFRLGSSRRLRSPLSWADGLALVHSAAPGGRHLLALLGQSDATAVPGRPAQETPSGSSGRLRSREPSSSSSRPHGLPSRLIQYPLTPSKGRITVTTEDLACLDSGEFLNDVIIDFYLKYLLLERAGGQLAGRCHVFSSFFYRQLTRPGAAGEEADAVPARDRRHQRVKTWTRHIDIFNKDYLFVPVNQKAHWYLVVICFPGLEEVQYEQRPTPALLEGPDAGGQRVNAAHSSPRSHSTPDCTLLGCQREAVCKRPSILVMDSLKLSYHESIFKLIREYLQVEWEVRRGTPRRFTLDSMRSSHCRVPLQDNSSDCGLYLLQYVETFLQNPVVHFDDLPLRLERWFPRQQVWRKREEIRRLIMQLHGRQGDDGETSNR